MIKKQSSNLKKILLLSTISLVAFSSAPIAYMDSARSRTFSPEDIYDDIYVTFNTTWEKYFEDWGIVYEDMNIDDWGYIGNFKSYPYAGQTFVDEGGEGRLDEYMPIKNNYGNMIEFAIINTSSEKINYELYRVDVDSTETLIAEWSIDSKDTYSATKNDVDADPDAVYKIVAKSKDGDILSDKISKTNWAYDGYMPIWIAPPVYYGEDDEDTHEPGLERKIFFPYLPNEYMNDKMDSDWYKGKMALYYYSDTDELYQSLTDWGGERHYNLSYLFDMEETMESSLFSHMWLLSPRGALKEEVINKEELQLYYSINMYHSQFPETESYANEDLSLNPDVRGSREEWPMRATNFGPLVIPFYRWSNSDIPEEFIHILDIYKPFSMLKKNDWKEGDDPINEFDEYVPVGRNDMKLQKINNSFFMMDDVTIENYKPGTAILNWNFKPNMDDVRSDNSATVNFLGIELYDSSEPWDEPIKIFESPAVKGEKIIAKDDWAYSEQEHNLTFKYYWETEWNIGANTYITNDFGEKEFNLILSTDVIEDIQLDDTDKNKVFFDVESLIEPSILKDDVEINVVYEDNNGIKGEAVAEFEGEKIGESGLYTYSVTVPNSFDVGSEFRELYYYLSYGGAYSPEEILYYRSLEMSNDNYLFVNDDKNVNIHIEGQNEFIPREGNDHIIWWLLIAIFIILLIIVLIFMIIRIILFLGESKY